MRYRHEIDNVRAHVRSLWGVIVLQVLVIAGVCIGWLQAPERLVIHIPPDLRDGATLEANEVRPANVYAFGFYIFQQLNRWPEDGADDYPEAIFRLSPYLTERFRAELIESLALKGQRGELAHRTRHVQSLNREVGDDAVSVLDANAWRINLALRLTESVRGMTIKETAIEYPLRVVRHPIDPELNPWGLALDGYVGSGPQRLPESSS